MVRRVAEVLRRLAPKTRRTRTLHAREAVLTYLEELDDLHLAKKRLATPAKRWSHADLEADADLDPTDKTSTVGLRPPTA